MRDEDWRFIHKHWQKFRNGRHPGITVMPVNEKYTHYHALIKGPDNSPFAGASFSVCVKFDARYPFATNQIRVYFLTPIYHPAVFWEETYEELDMFQTSKICYPRLRGAEIPLREIFNDLRYDFLLKPNTFLHDPANEAALADMFEPSRNRLGELKLEEAVVVSSSSVKKKIVYLPDLAALFGDTNEIRHWEFKRLMKSGEIDRIVSWLQAVEGKIREYADRIAAPYPESISDALHQILKKCKEEDLYGEKARIHFTNQFLITFFKLIFYQSQWWIRAAEATRKYALDNNQKGTFEEWNCPIKE